MKNLQIIFVITALFIFGNCKKGNDPGNNTGNENPVATFANSCCAIPPLDECYKGVGIFAPNAFTPNADGVNDLFQIHAYGFELVMSFKIMDADNNLIFSRFNYSPNNPHIWGWDGTDPDGNVLEDIFQYEIEIQAIDGAIITYNGSVCSRLGNPPPCVDNEKKCAYGTQHDGQGRFCALCPSHESCE